MSSGTFACFMGKGVIQKGISEAHENRLFVTVTSLRGAPRAINLHRFREIQNALYPDFWQKVIGWFCLLHISPPPEWDGLLCN